MTNYLYYELFQDIKKYMDNHLRQVKDKSEANTSPEEKNLSKLVFFNLVFILQYIQTFLKDVIQFLTQKDCYYSEIYNKFIASSINNDNENEENEINNNNSINQNNNEEDYIP